MKKIVLWGILVFMSMGVTGCLSDDDDNPEGANIQIGDKLPDFSVRLNDDRLINRQLLEGKVSVIILFTVTCPDCQKQLPVIEQVYKTYGDRDNISILGISRAQGEAEVGDFWKKRGYTFPYSAQDTREVYSLFAKSGVPRIYLSDGDGVVVRMFSDNPLASLDELKDILDQLLSKQNKEK